ncbi:hypothetical protein KFK09_014644 [Dendrobium nobile]|uniref:Uncharacterized protein n=1 Tax=Dendrobium nobile TaxID=94219 RepID=A0A8T3B8L1_DENNO|nr:hypothetical protein KFK09_014644 [Dendrobium nobile]
MDETIEKSVRRVGACLDSGFTPDLIELTPAKRHKTQNKIEESHERGERCLTFRRAPVVSSDPTGTTLSKGGEAASFCDSFKTLLNLVTREAKEQQERPKSKIQRRTKTDVEKNIVVASASPCLHSFFNPVFGSRQFFLFYIIRIVNVI